MIPLEQLKHLCSLYESHVLIILVYILQQGTKRSCLSDVLQICLKNAGHLIMILDQLFLVFRLNFLDDRYLRLFYYQCSFIGKYLKLPSDVTSFLHPHLDYLRLYLLSHFLWAFHRTVLHTVVVINLRLSRAHESFTVTVPSEFDSNRTHHTERAL